MLPQVLAGLGALSLLSAGCLLWLERLQPVFAALAVAALVYQGWLVWRRPAYLRTRQVLVIFWASIGTSVMVLLVWVTSWLRYR
jgi:hypothetical protein